MKFRKKPVEVEALQLRWDNWGEMCDFVGVGHLTDGKPEGTYIDSDGDHTNPSHQHHWAFLSQHMRG